MAQIISAHFDSTPEDPRMLMAEDWARFIGSFIGDGVRNGGTNLRVTADGTGMFTQINEGFANIQGYFCWCDRDMDSVLYRLEHPASHPEKPRIDRIVLRLDRTIGVRAIIPMVLRGEAADNPVPPVLNRNQHIWDISLAQVRLPAGVYAVKGSYIVDERLDSSVCGIINSLISADTQGLYHDFHEAYVDFLAEHSNHWHQQLEQLEETLVNRFNKQYNTINAWYDAVLLDISLVQTFNFDNLFELQGTTRITTFSGDKVIELALISDTDMMVAKRETTIKADKSAVSRTALYNRKNESILRETETTTIFNPDGSIEERTVSVL